jgi:hypothetical protein
MTLMAEQFHGQQGIARKWPENTLWLAQALHLEDFVPSAA